MWRDGLSGPAAVTGTIIAVAGRLYWLDPTVAVVIAAVIAYHAARLSADVAPTLRRPQIPLQVTGQPTSASSQYGLEFAKARSHRWKSMNCWSPGGLDRENTPDANINSCGHLVCSHAASQRAPAVTIRPWRRRRRTRAIRRMKRDTISRLASAGIRRSPASLAPSTTDSRRTARCGGCLARGAPMSAADSLVLPRPTGAM